MKNLFYLLIVSTIMLACVTNSDKLQFSEFEIMDGNGAVGITLSEEGKIEFGGENIGEINRNGTLNDRDGKLLAEITDENILQDENGEYLVKIDENGRIDNGSGMFIEWSENGELMEGNKKAGMSITPVDKKSLQTASIILFLYLSMSDEKSTSPIIEIN